MSELLLDRADRRRSPATMPGFHAGHGPGNKGLRYPADPPKVAQRSNENRHTHMLMVTTSGVGDHHATSRDICSADGPKLRRLRRASRAIKIALCV